MDAARKRQLKRWAKEYFSEDTFFRYKPNRLQDWPTALIMTIVSNKMAREQKWKEKIDRAIRHSIAIGTGYLTHML